MPTECNNPKCHHPARDDDMYMDGFGDVYCGIPCMMNHGAFPNTPCKRCNKLTPENEVDVYRGICGSCYQDLADAAAQERYERNHNPDYKKEDWKDFYEWTERINA